MEDFLPMTNKEKKALQLLESIRHLTVDSVKEVSAFIEALKADSTLTNEEFREQYRAGKEREHNGI
jgi:hypothetical protein